MQFNSSSRRSLILLPALNLTLACESQPKTLDAAPTATASLQRAPVTNIVPAASMNADGGGGAGVRPPSASDSRSYAVTGVPNGDVLNVRRLPSAGSEKVGALAPSSTGIRSTGRTQTAGGTTWLEIDLSNGVNGWVNKQFLAEEQGQIGTERGAVLGGSAPAVRITSASEPAAPSAPSAIAGAARPAIAGPTASVPSSVVGSCSWAFVGIQEDYVRDAVVSFSLKREGPGAVAQTFDVNKLSLGRFPACSNAGGGLFRLGLILTDGDSITRLHLETNKSLVGEWKRPAGLHSLELNLVPDQNQIRSESVGWTKIAVTITPDPPVAGPIKVAFDLEGMIGETERVSVKGNFRGTVRERK